MNRTCLRSSVFFLLFFVSIAHAGVFELYGLGKVGLNYSVASSGRGKASTAYADSLTANLQNPANLAYLRKAGMEMSLNTRHNMISGTGNTNNYSGFSYGLLKFPLAGKGALSLGITPLTSSNASYRISNAAQGYEESSYSRGNIYSANLNAAYSFFRKGQLAIGAGAEFLLGGYTIIRDIAFENEDLTEVSIESDESFSGSQFTGGITVTPFPWLSLGAAYTRVTNSTRREIIHYMANSEHYFYSHLDSAGISEDDVFPDQLRLGLAFTPAPRYILTADWMRYRFEGLASDFSFNPFYEGAAISSFDHFGLGFEKQGVLNEYLPYYRSLTYRGGLYFQRHYLRDPLGVPVRTYGLTLGLGLPFTEFRNRVDAAFVCEYNTGTVYATAGIDPVHVNEFVYHLTVSITIAETWFNTRGKYR